MSNAEIAERLTLELGTVKTHVHNILDKLNVSSRHEAAAFFSDVGERAAPRVRGSRLAIFSRY
jgi:DNA-binding NarL/FixJ family response regulator